MEKTVIFAIGWRKWAWKRWKFQRFTG